MKRCALAIAALALACVAALACCPALADAFPENLTNDADKKTVTREIWNQTSEKQHFACSGLDSYIALTDCLYDQKQIADDAEYDAKVRAWDLRWELVTMAGYMAFIALNSCPEVSIESTSVVYSLYFTMETPPSLEDIAEAKSRLQQLRATYGTAAWCRLFAKKMEEAYTIAQESPRHPGMAWFLLLHPQ